MKTIAIHDHHNASVAYMEDGKIKFAIQEERLVRIKNAGGTPKYAIMETLKQNNLKFDDIDYFIFVGHGGKLDTVDAKSHYLNKYRDFFEDYNKNFYLRGEVKKNLKKLPGIKFFSKYKKNRNLVKKLSERKSFLHSNGVSDDRISFQDHHTCHASAAAYGWGKDETLIVTLDSAGDGIAGTINTFIKGKIERLNTVDTEDSLARLYSLITYYLGMVPMDHEYKVMGLSSYNKSEDKVREIANYFHSLFEIDSQDLLYKRQYNIEPVYEMGPRLQEFLKYKRFDHVAGGVQLFLEEFVSEWIRSLVKKTGYTKIACAGGLFMNVKLNKAILDLEEVEDMFIFPSCGDETNVFGALYKNHFDKTNNNPDTLYDFYYGTNFSDEEISKTLESFSLEEGVKYEKKKDIEKEVACLLAEGNIVARYKGYMEFGARALGNRSILADPSNYESVKEINSMIKNRDFWMPFSASILAEDSDIYIKKPKEIFTPYMILLLETHPLKRKSIIGAIHPYDYTCRPQEVTKEMNNDYHYLIKEFKKITGESAILNTSFNLHGYPIVYNPEDALSVFQGSGLNFLALGNYLLWKDK